MSKTEQTRKYLTFFRRSASRQENGASATRLPRSRHWRAGLAIAAGVALLAAAGGYAATMQPVANRTGLSGATASSGKTTASSAANTSGAAASQGSGNSAGSSGPVGPVPGSGQGGPVPPAGSSGAKGVLFGGDVPLADAEPELGRTLAIVRVYDLIGQQFMNKKVAAIMARGSTLLVSLDTYPPHGPSYASIAAGHEDGAIRDFLEAADQAAIHYKLGAIYVTFEHEANNLGKHQGLGSPAQFVQAWDHVHQLAVQAHLDWNQGGRLHWALILTHYAYLNGSISQYWPGTGEVDVVAADGYNTGGCRTARQSHTGFKYGRTSAVSPASLFSKLVSFGAAHGRLPVFIAEWGSVPYTSPRVRVRFIQQMQAFVQANPEIRAALYWDSQQVPCNYIVDNSPTSVAALAAMGHSPGFQGRVTS